MFNAFFIRTDPTQSCKYNDQMDILDHICHLCMPANWTGHLSRGEEHTIANPACIIKTMMEHVKTKNTSMVAAFPTGFTVYDNRRPDSAGSNNADCRAEHARTAPDTSYTLH
jgi:hypothetical protein